MIRHKLYNAFTQINAAEKSAIVEFLHKNLNGRPVSKNEIEEAVNYAVKERPSFGGFVLTANEADRILGTILVNCTGMEGFNPKNRLVYLAIDKKRRRNGVARKLLKEAIQFTKGDLALQVEPGNTSIKLFEQLGFQTQYLEMRFANP
jgi:GNAT superfamily N-acetyltransferase